MKRKRILYCEGNVDGTIGGSFYSLLYLVEGLDRSHYEPIVIFHRDNALIETYRAAGIDTRVIVPYPAIELRTAIGWLAPFLKVLQRGINFWRKAIKEGLRCALYLRRHRIDLVHLNNSIKRNHHWMFAAWVTGRPCITHERGINDIYERAARFFAARLKAVICISNAVRDTLVSRGIPGDRLVIVHNGLDAARVQPRATAADVRERHGIRPGEPVIGMVGNIKEWKGQDVVIRATARLRERWPNIRCLLVGDTAADDRYYEERLHQMVRGSRLQANIIFTGYRKDVADYMNAMDVVIHASVQPEPFGRVLIEAMAIGKPVVGARDGAVTEIVLHGETGFTFPPGDDAALATEVEKLLASPETAAAMGEKARRRVKEEFGIVQNIKRTEAIYEQIFAGDPPRRVDLPQETSRAPTSGMLAGE